MLMKVRYLYVRFIGGRGVTLGNGSEEIKMPPINDEGCVNVCTTEKSLL
jgi:hypothetical protein